MAYDYMPRSIRATYLAAGLVLGLMLALSAALTGQSVIDLGGNAVAALKEDGIREAVKGFGNHLLTDLADRFGIGSSGFTTENELRSLLGIVPGFLTLAVFCLIWPIVWLALARMALQWITFGFWAWQRDYLPAELPQDWRDPSEIMRWFDTRKGYINEDLSRAEVALLGERGRYIPRHFSAAARRLLNPLKEALTSALHALFWGLMTLLCLVILSFLGTSVSGLGVPDFSGFLQSYLSQSVLRVVPWLAITAAISVLCASLDFTFVRALVPPTAPQVRVNSDAQMNWMKSNSKPEQFLTMFRARLQQINPDLRIIMSAVENSNQDNDRHADFKVRLLIEDQPQRDPNYAALAAQRRLVAAQVIALFGAAILLFALLPLGAIHAFAEGEAGLSQLVSAPVWLAMAIATGQGLVRQGRRLTGDAIEAQIVTWYRSPVVLLELIGSINTQKSMTGKAINDSFGTESSVQQSVFRCRFLSATVVAEAASPEGARSLWSYDADAASEDLLLRVRGLLSGDHDESVMNASRQEIRDIEQLEGHRLRREIESALPAPSLDVVATQSRENSEEE